MAADRCQNIFDPKYMFEFGQDGKPYNVTHLPNVDFSRYEQPASLKQAIATSLADSVEFSVSDNENRPEWEDVIETCKLADAHFFYYGFDRNRHVFRAKSQSVCAVHAELKKELSARSLASKFGDFSVAKLHSDGEAY